ncbi:hypothetical protein J6590_047306 [Homalodisca vitripennis]|nr:hypothetical protein J6590_047306 [Homalodisca vitripennis]
MGASLGDFLPAYKANGTEGNKDTSVPVSTETGPSATLNVPTRSSETIKDKSPTENDPYVGWVYRLDKTQLRNELLKYNLGSEGKVDELRKRFVAYLRLDKLTTSECEVENENNMMDYEGVLGGNSVSQTHRVLSSNEQNESMALREILGLPPNADSRTLRAMILSLKTTRESQPSANGTMETPHTNVVHSHQSMLVSY